MIRLKPIIPRGRNRLDPGRQRAAIFKGLEDAALEATKDFEKTSATWSHQPSYSMKRRADGYEIGTGDDIWNMLNKGTRPHVIIAHGRRLRFRSGYTAKTRPGYIGSQSGGASGDTVYRKMVHHPGTKARNWSTLIGKRWRALLGGYVQRRIHEAVS